MCLEIINDGRRQQFHRDDPCQSLLRLRDCDEHCQSLLNDCDDHSCGDVHVDYCRGVAKPDHRDAYDDPSDGSWFE